MRYFISLIGLYRGCGKGITSNRIVSGSEADPHSIPWQAALVRKGEWRPFCGGTIIFRRFIMTAAHCMYLKHQLIGPHTFQIVAGVHNWRENGAIWKRLGRKPRHEQRRDIENFVMHPSYEYPSQDYDYAIIKLIKPFKLKGRSKARAACLPNPTKDINFQPGTNFTVSGWGWLFDEARGQPHVLHHVTVPAISDAECKKVYKTEFSDRMHCAGDLQNGGIDACNGDSGGKFQDTISQLCCNFL